MRTNPILSWCRRPLRVVQVLVIVASLSLFTGFIMAADTIPVTITIDASRTSGELTPIWRFFGYDEPNYTYMKDGKKLLGELSQLSSDQTVFVRTHSLLVTGDGTPAVKWGSTNVYTEDASGKPIYDWTIVDRIFDTYRERGMRPYVQIGFMPQALSIKPEPYRHRWKPGDKYDTIYTGWAYPPKDYGKWAELVYQWTRHCVEKYGREETLKWYWEVWNEPNIGYWQGTREEFFKLHDYAIDAVRRALPGAKVGGPDVAGGPGGTFLKEFLDHCLTGTNFATGAKGTPIDFISFHAKGGPSVVDGHVRMGISNELRDIDRAFAVIASYPDLKNKPIVIGECDPDGCAACSAALYPQNAYRNGTLYASYTAASFARIHDLAQKHGVNLEGALTWAFEFEDQPYFRGYRTLATNGIDKPVLNVFRMMGMMSGKRIEVTSTTGVSLDDMVGKGVREQPDVTALASFADRKLYVLLWHYHDDNTPGPDADVTVSLNNLPAGATTPRVEQYLIDQAHSNAYTLWQKMGSPQQPTAQQYAELEKAGQLQRVEPPMLDGSSRSLKLLLPRQSVALIVVSW